MKGGMISLKCFSFMGSMVFTSNNSFFIIFKDEFYSLLRNASDNYRNFSDCNFFLPSTLLFSCTLREGWEN